MSKNILLIAMSFHLAALAGCTSYFVRKDCEKNNWSEYGYSLAMKGVRPANDPYLDRCRKAETEINEAQLDRGFKEGMANYCRPEVAKQTGKNGDTLNMDLCDPGQARILLAKHMEGLREYCLATNGYSIGASGKVYGKNCPADLEKAFLKEYQRGRKKWLAAMVAESQNKLVDLDHDIMNKNNQIHNLQFEIATIPLPPQQFQRNVDGSVTNIPMTDPNQNRRQNLNWELSAANSEITNLQKQQSDERAKMYEYQRELNTIE